MREIVPGLDYNHVPGTWQFLMSFSESVHFGPFLAAALGFILMARLDGAMRLGKGVQMCAEVVVNAQHESRP